MGNAEFTLGGSSSGCGAAGLEPWRIQQFPFLGGIVASASTSALRRWCLRDSILLNEKGSAERMERQGATWGETSPENRPR
ncbi:hypothetical protein AXF42_Ash005384 [Apostasia shenzhenica]|uniref:Uncharacterized protein n=1 Tax=Apostasia shenzhenica TaxID=1088818 RepID=A0A2I0B6R7_9ASPA|nr:hypothetical protein AXF42_Ash005384 [Apostasia shenzhenica]